MSQLKNSSTKIVDIPKDQRTKTQKILSFLTWTCGLSIIPCAIWYGESPNALQTIIYQTLLIGFVVFLVAYFVFND